MMNIISLLQADLAEEAQVTRKFLALVPLAKGDWAPHERSMKMINLATHIAELPGWVSLGLTTDELDFATSPYEQVRINSTEELLAHFEKNLEECNKELAKASEEILNERWVLRNGETILAELTKYGIIRSSMSQITHHRAQLGVYFRLLEIPVPGSYGPSADDENF